MMSPEARKIVRQYRRRLFLVQLTQWLAPSTITLVIIAAFMLGGVL